MARYLMKWYPVDDGATLNQVFKLQILPEASPVSHYKLLRFKTYKKTNCLVYPNTDFANFVQALETLFCAISGGVLHMNDLLKTLCKNAEKEVTHLHKCGRSECEKRLHDIVNYTWLLGFILPLKSLTLAGCMAIKNWKMLKLCHEQKWYCIYCTDYFLMNYKCI